MERKRLTETWLGLDGGLLNIGLAVCSVTEEEITVIETKNFNSWFSPKKNPTFAALAKNDPTRMDWIIEEAGAWFEGQLNTWHPQVIVIESCHFRSAASNSTSKVAEVRGCFRWLALTHTSRPAWKEVSPSEVKKSVGGRFTGGDKRAIGHAVADLFLLPHLLERGRDHEADALACVVTQHKKEKAARESLAAENSAMATQNEKPQSCLIEL